VKNFRNRLARLERLKSAGAEAWNPVCVTRDFDEDGAPVYLDMSGDLPWPVLHQGKVGETHEQMEKRLGITSCGSFEFVGSPLDDESQ